MWPSVCANLEDTHLCLGLRAGQRGRLSRRSPSGTRIRVLGSQVPRERPRGTVSMKTLVAPPKTPPSPF